MNTLKGFLYCDDEELQTVAVEGLCKLMLLKVYQEKEASHCPIPYAKLKPDSACIDNAVLSPGHRK